MRRDLQKGMNRLTPNQIAFLRPQIKKAPPETWRQREAVVWIRQQGGRAWTPLELAAVVPTTDPFKFVARLVKRNIVRRVARGQYVAVRWDERVIRPKE